MKLYTEEQMRKIYDLAFINLDQDGSYIIDGDKYFQDKINELTPIEIPSDEEMLIERFNSDEFVNNVCLSYRHDFGLLSEENKKFIIFECQEWMRAIFNNWSHHERTNT